MTIEQVRYLTPVPPIANEALEKWSHLRPATLGQVARIPGINPADISALTIYLVSRKATEGSVTSG